MAKSHITNNKESNTNPQQPEKFIKGCDVVELKDLSLKKIQEFVNSHQAMRLINPGGELFQYTENGTNMGILIDIQSLNLILKVYDAINEKNKENFHLFLNDEYKLASMMDKMWGWVA